MTRNLLPAAALMALAALPVAAIADDHETPPALTDVWLIVPKQGMAAEFEAAIEAHMAYRTNRDDSADWEVYRAVIGDNPNLYQFRSSGLEWADLDAYAAEGREKGFGEHWDSNVDQYVDHYHHYLERTDWENSHWPEDAGPFRYYGVTTWTWKQGAGPGPDEARSEFSQLAKNAGWADAGNEWLWLSRIGGEPKLMVATGFADYADMEPPEQSFYEFLVEEVGADEAAATIATFSDGFSESEYTVWLHLENLSTPSDDD